jgi:hypothetical protein
MAGILVDSKDFFNNQVNRWLFVFLMALNIIVWALWVDVVIPLGSQSIYLPTSIPVDSIRLYSLPILGSFFSLVNLFLACISSKKEVLISFYLLVTSILIEILILVLIRRYLI